MLVAHVNTVSFVLLSAHLALAQPSASPTSSPTRAPSAAPTATPTTIMPSAAPTAAPTATPTATLSTVPLVIVRPFYDGDIDLLVASFSAWNQPTMPCALVDGVPTHGTVDLLLYYSRNVSESTAVQAIASQLDASTDTWRACIGTISVLGANLTESEDVYNPTGDGVDWNRGPNTQFYRMATLFESSDIPFFYMEGDTVPVKSGWLDAIRSEILSKSPFAVLGSRYAGHNWDRYMAVDPPVLPDALLYHLNGNAVYNASHVFVQDVVAAETTVTFADVPHSSFDVRFCEVAMQELGYTEATLESMGYKQTSIVANFASTLVLPSAVPSSAYLVHGARMVYDWESRSTTGGLDDDITLVVSDWGENNELSTFVSSISTLSLPFDSFALITQDSATAQAAADAFPSVVTSASGRDWSVGTAEWDLCTAAVTTTWFMHVSTHYRASDSFGLPTTNSTYKPLIPYKLRDSIYCDCVCKDRVDEGAAITDGYEYDIEAQHAVLHTSTRDAYCASLASQTAPSINGYFAYVLGNASVNDDDMYVFYDRERYGVISTLEPPESVESQCSSTVPAAASCVFPFKYRNVTYDNCTVVGTAGAYGTGPETEDGGRAYRASGANLPWCATSVTADGEADEWKYCRSDIVGYVPGNEGTRRYRARDRRDTPLCTSTGGSFTCAPTSSPTSSTSLASSTSMAPTTVSPTASLAPVSFAPTTTAPTMTLAPVTFAPTTIAPTASLAPVSVAPTTYAPVTRAPVTAAPVTFAPTASLAPVSHSPTTFAPVSAAPTTISPVYAPTTNRRSKRSVPPGQSYAPTTMAPTTVSPTATLAPQSHAPTSIAPTTVAPTSAAPTTAAPTATLAPISYAPTTLSPTTMVTATFAPVTIAPTAGLPPVSYAPTTVSPTSQSPSSVFSTLSPTTYYRLVAFYIDASCETPSNLASAVDEMNTRLAGLGISASEATVMSQCGSTSSTILISIIFRVENASVTVHGKISNGEVQIVLGGNTHVGYFVPTTTTAVATTSAPTVARASSDQSNNIVDDWRFWWAMGSILAGCLGISIVFLVMRRRQGERWDVPVSPDGRPLSTTSFDIASWRSPRVASAPKIKTPQHESVVYEMASPSINMVSPQPEESVKPSAPVNEPAAPRHRVVVYDDDDDAQQRVKRPSESADSDEWSAFFLKMEADRASRRKRLTSAGLVSGLSADGRTVSLHGIPSLPTSSSSRLQAGARSLPLEGSSQPMVEPGSPRVAWSADLSQSMTSLDLVDGLTTDGRSTEV